METTLVHVRRKTQRVAGTDFHAEATRLAQLLVNDDGHPALSPWHNTLLSLA